MTRRERLEARAARRRNWADARRAKATAATRQADDAVRGIEPGQPILVGHHSERRHRRALERHDAAMARAVESADAAAAHASRASNLEAALERSIFSDDRDAVDALRARIARLQAERDACKAVNAAWRRAGKPGIAPADADAWRSIGASCALDDAAIARIVARIRLTPYHPMPYPTYHLSGIGAQIRTAERRIQEVTLRKERAAEAEGAGGLTVRESGEWCSVTFAEKPDRDVLDELRAAGFRWRQGSWHGPIARLPTSVQPS